MSDKSYLSDDILINSLKFDNTIHKSWRAKLIASDDSLLTFQGEFESEIDHHVLGVIRRGTVSLEFYWLDRWYNIFCFQNPDGSFRNFYCNISMPPIFADNILNYIDLDIDLLVSEDFSFQVLDVDEFEENALKYSYSNELIEKAWSSVREVIYLIENRKFPFDRDF